MRQAGLYCAVICVFSVIVGCQAGKFSPPSFPKFPGFKKKEAKLAPPSRTFDTTTDQIAAASDAKKKLTEIPGEGDGSNGKLPSQTARPSDAMSTAKNKIKLASDSTKSDGERKAFQLPEVDEKFQQPAVGDPLATSSPIRKPYEYAQQGSDSLNKAAEKLTGDWDRTVAEKSKEVSNEFNQFSNSPDRNFQNSNPLSPSANSTSIASQAALAPREQSQPSNNFDKPVPGVGAGGAFVLGQTSANNSEMSVSSSNSPTRIAHVTPSNSNVIARSDPGLAPQSSYSSQSSTNSGTSFPSNSFSAAPSNSTAPASSFAAPSSKNVASIRSPATQPDSSSYPQTPFNGFVAKNSPAPLPQDPSTANPINGDWTTPPPTGGAVATIDKAPSASANQPVSYTAALPDALIQGTGSYAPGSTRKLAPVSTNWR